MWWLYIHPFVSCLQVVKTCYPLTGQRKELVELQFVFDTNETELTCNLDPEDSITSLKEDWTQQ